MLYKHKYTYNVINVKKVAIELNQKGFGRADRYAISKFADEWGGLSRTKI